ncbi:glycoside hydrolase family 38 N-terminal domain-containing protein [Agromyces ramosus]|uniref:Mannosylglycerate hydrolase n=1 Tax=Agromyces ramosus TaxID=33879 RepID=A0ABU0R7X3_9MICO|nr:glycoside hydrolase family 38 C-terminal domain-containing protein [Agromyces ramosus]MDQ0894169.1 mannosylglycerate hydrolase [Agromyces ramosus]
MDAPDELVIVPHTHWDREWYEPRDVFRLRLVHMVDRLLDTLEANPGYRFTLDGQAAAIDDYLEIRPEQRERVVAAVGRGQLAIGPFLILLDEFLCDGETIVRNLELGLRSSRRVGPEMRIGYLPDMFGHAAQMPQILRGFGLRDAALWRGVPARVERHAFAWTAPDGSTVRTEYLLDGYGNALDLFALPGQLEALVAEYGRSIASWFGSDPILGMLGTDHSAPPADLMPLVDAANAAAGHIGLTVDTIEGYVRRAAPEWAAGDDGALTELPEVIGELRSHARGNLLPGVFSIRTNLKRAMSDAERRLSTAERLDAAFGADDHRAFFDSAWYRLVESTAHDSVTGCGVDATAVEVEGRLATAGHVARGVILRTMERLAASVTPDSHVVANPAGFARRAHVEIRLHDPERLELGDGVQLLDALPEVLGDEQLTTAELPKLLNRIHGRELFGQLINSWRFTDDGLRFEVAEAPVGEFDLAAFTEELERRIAADPSGARRWHVEIIADPRRRAVVGVDVGGLGVASLDPATARATDDPVTVSGRMLTNRQLTVTVDDHGAVRIEAADGTVLTDVLRLVDEGDRGDSYNYGPVDATTAVTEPASVEVSVIEPGPIRGRLHVRRTYVVPGGLDSADRNRRLSPAVELVVDTVLELREGEPILRVRMDLVNPATDHRLRVLVPTGVADLDGSSAAGQYAVTRRGRMGEGGPVGEFPLPTYPVARFVHAGQASVIVTKHSEYEIVADSQSGVDAIALTLVRAVGLMSVNVHPLRDEPAGGEFPVPGAQYLGTPVATEFAILPSASGWAASGTARWAELVRVEPEVARGTQGGPTVVGGVAGAGGAAEAAALSTAPALEVASDVVLESLRSVTDAAGLPVSEARFVNYRGESQRLRAAASGIWDRTDFAGDVLEPAVDLESYVIGAARIETFRRRNDDTPSDLG